MNVLVPYYRFVNSTTAQKVSMAKLASVQVV